jgi:N-acetylmuramoyl-L-alanine amidase
MRKINKIIIHCSASDVVSYDFAAIRSDHMRNRQFTDIGYHFGIDWDGDIHILRPIKQAGAHAQGFNSHSIGVCVLGLNSFTNTQLQQLGTLVKTLCWMLDLPLEAVIPHNKVNPNKTCPNFDLVLWKAKYVGEL